MKKYVILDNYKYFEEPAHAAAVDEEIWTKLNQKIGVPADENILTQKGVWYNEELHRVAEEF